MAFSKTNFKLFNLVLIAILFAQSNMAYAKDTSSHTFDDQRPADISDKKWSSLKVAVKEAKLLPTPIGVGGGAGSQLGSSVSVDGDRALIAAPYAISSQGAVYIMDFIGGDWVKTQELTSGYGVFGSSVSLSGDRALVGAYHDNSNGSNSGSAYIFDLSGGKWSQTTKLTAADGAANDEFGISVALSGDRALIGAYQDDDDGTSSGSAYVFDLSGGTSWSQTTKLTAADGAVTDRFGVSVSLFGDRALIGARWDDDNGTSSGSAYVFDLIGETWSQTTKLTAADGAAGDNFGLSVSLSGDSALIGAHLDDDNGSNSGSAYVFDLNAGTWLQTAKFTTTDGAESDFFGGSVSLSGDRLLIGAYQDDDNGNNSGSAYVFDLSGGTWSQTAKISNDGAAGDFFGYSVSLSGDRVLVGAYQDDDNGNASGSAYVFDLIGETWSRTVKLTADDGEADDNFGYSVSLSGDRALVGAILDDSNGTSSGSAYVFDLNGGTWLQTAKLIAEDGAVADTFGFSVSISGDRALIGALGDDDNGSNSGSVYVFDLSGGTWSQMIKLTAGNGAANDRFGYSVSLSGDRALVGALYGDDDFVTNSGSAYVFELNGGTWSQTTKLTAADGAASDRFGCSVSLSGDRALIGAWFNDDNGFSSGSAYVFDLNTGTWSQTAKLTASDNEAGDYFGWSLSLSGDRALVGAYQDDDNGSASGSAYVFDFNAGTWSQTVKFTAGDGTANDYFGNSVSLSGYRALVGAYRESDRGVDSGSSYIINLDPNLVFSDGFEEIIVIK